MTIKEKVFKWLEKHPNVLNKTGYGSNSELRAAFPQEDRKTLSMYKMQFKREKEQNLNQKKNEIKLGKKLSTDSKDEGENKMEKEELEENHNIKINFDKKAFLIIIPIIILLLWFFLKWKKEDNE